MIERRVIAMAIGLAWGCGSPGEPVLPVAAFVISPALDTLTALGARTMLVPVARADDGSRIVGVVPEWTSADPGTATVDSAGVVTAVANGATTITARLDNHAATAEIVVAQVTTHIEVSGADTLRAVGAVAQYVATPLDAEDHPVVGVEVTWGTTDSSVITVTAKGEVTAERDGTARVVANARAGPQSSLLTGNASVRVYLPVGAVTIAPDSFTVVPGAALGLTATVHATSGDEIFGHPVAWASTNPQVVAVDSTGRITGLAAGSASVTATVDGVQGVGTVTVKVLTFTMVSAGDLHTCGLTTEGEAYCWGYDFRGQLAAAVPTDSCIWWDGQCALAPTPVAGGLRFVALDAGEDHTCALTASGDAYCWGFNDAGQLGSSLANPGTCIGGPCAREPTLVEGGLSFTALSAGLRHTCALTGAGAAYCWGSNAFGQLGDGTTATSPTPVEVAGGIVFASISAGGGHTCGVTSSGDAFCWGHNTQGHVGDSTYVDRLTPVAVAGGHQFQSVTAGSRDHTCGVTTAGDAFCWGCNEVGKLGVGPNATLRTDCDHRTCAWTPMLVTGSHLWSGVLPASYHTCGLRSDGTAYCWGGNWVGQLGNGETAGTPFNPVPHPTPLAVTGGLRFVPGSLSTGGGHTCGIGTDGFTYCWGLNDGGQAGALEEFWVVSPVRVPGQMVP